MNYGIIVARSRSSMDRVPDFESVGCAFESRREHFQIYIGYFRNFLLVSPTMKFSTIKK